jgi:hypothetical protein
MKSRAFWWTVPVTTVLALAMRRRRIQAPKASPGPPIIRLFFRRTDGTAGA